VRHVRMLGLCLAAAFAVAAIAATSASALPEFGKCEEKAGGKYTESNCVKKATLKSPGNFEFKKASELASAHRHFLGLSNAGVLDGVYKICSPNDVREQTCGEGEEEGNFLSEPGKPLKVECSHEVNHGEISGNNTVAHISVIFRGCLLLGSAPCENTINEGEIQVNELKGSIGFINKKTTPRQVGLLLEPVQKHGEFAKFTCLGGGIGTVVGEGDAAEGCAYPQKLCGGDGIIGAMTPVNTSTSEFTQTFTASEETGENLPGKFEGKPVKQLESYVYNVERPEFSTKWSKAGEEITNLATDCVENPENGATECPNGAKEIGEIKAN
jgi:hypothetical protein